MQRCYVILVNPNINTAAPLKYLKLFLVKVPETVRLSESSKDTSFFK